jgi:hypothetical protein
MYLRTAVVNNIRHLDEVEWSLPGKQRSEGWHVILGDNGSGKSTLLRSIALALIGPWDALALRQDWGEWLRPDSSEGSVFLVLRRDEAFDSYSGGGRTLKNYSPNAKISLLRDPSGTVTLRQSTVAGDPERSVWGTGAGWFSASYGPFRRFDGGDKDFEKLFYSHPKMARHLSVFGESVALSECLEWLKLLQFKRLEHDPEAAILAPLQAFINQPNFLPHSAHLHEISSSGVRFIDGNGCEVLVENLSDGYRSILSMTFELIRQMATTYGAHRIFSADDPYKVAVPGIVLVDEIDAHLHPTWQRQIGQWFRRHFPRVQFIVTSHSPLICQAAEVGSVFRLRRPGSTDSSAMLSGTELDRILYGNVLDAYSSGAFGDSATRSVSGEDKLNRLAFLNQREIENGLNGDEAEEQKTLRATFATSASIMPTSPAK